MVDLAPGAKANGLVNRVTKALAAAGLVRCPRTGIEAVTEAVNAVEKDSRVFVKNVLRAVTVVHVKIHNQNACQPVRVHGAAGRKGDVTEQAKPHAPDRRRMVTRRANEAQRVPFRPREDG